MIAVAPPPVGQRLRSGAVEASARTDAGGDAAHPELSIVVALYRDEDALEPIFDRCRPVLDAVDGGELVLVDDGGLDRTTTRAAALAERYPHPTTIVRLVRNFGQHPAVFAGLAHARGRRVVTLDSDLQYPPEEIPKLLAAMSPETPVVSGYREHRKDPWVRKLITRLLTRWLNARTGAQLRDFGSMFRAYDRATVDLMLTFTERHRYVPAVVSWLGVPIKEVPISHASRDRRSRYRISTLVEMLFDIVTGYSISPLRLLIGLGLAGALAGFAATVGFGIYRIAVGSGVSGTVSAFALTFGLLAIQLLLIAVIGEYVGRVYTEAQGRPYYLTGEVRRLPGARRGLTARSSR
jgi:undecaprenyl-phosphate 4-deoxy-4-formamido-L-arabinose transferase